MAIFDFLKEKKMREETVITFPALLGAVSRGQYVKMKEIPDEIFSTGVLVPAAALSRRRERYTRRSAGRSVRWRIRFMQSVSRQAG